MSYEFTMNGLAYRLDDAMCEAIFNDETVPVADLSLEVVNNWMAALDGPIFDLEYYEDDCESCPPKPRGKKKLVPFLEGHFYLFTKAGRVVLTSISPDFEAGSFDALLATGQVDDSYILSIVLCPNCGKFQIEVEQCEM